MAVSDRLVSRIRVLAITHIVVGALMIIIGVADGVTGALSSDSTFIGGYLFFGVWIGTWVSFTKINFRTLRAFLAFRAVLFSRFSTFSLVAVKNRLETSPKY